MLKSRARVQPGERVIVHAAGSGVSVAAIQIARLLGRAGLDDRGERREVREGHRPRGGGEAVNYRRSDFVAEVKRWTGGRGVDVVIDHIGTDTFDRSLRCLAREGRYVTCGATSGYELKTDFRPCSSRAFPFWARPWGEPRARNGSLPWSRRALLRPVVDRVFPFEQVANAHRYLAARGVLRQGGSHDLARPEVSMGHGR